MQPVYADNVKDYRKGYLVLRYVRLHVTIFSAPTVFVPLLCVVYYIACPSLPRVLSANVTHRILNFARLS